MSGGDEGEDEKENLQILFAGKARSTTQWKFHLITKWL
jgi:hypothetical protein